MALSKLYTRINWVNEEDGKITPLGATNLNTIDYAVDGIDDRVISLDTTKFDLSDAQTLIKDIIFDLQTGILTKYYYNGSTEKVNTGLSKLDMNLRFDEDTQTLYIVNADGTEDPVDLSTFITNYEFDDSDTVAFSASEGSVVDTTVVVATTGSISIEPDMGSGLVGTHLSQSCNAVQVGDVLDENGNVMSVTMSIGDESWSVSSGSLIELGTSLSTSGYTISFANNNFVTVTVSKLELLSLTKKQPGGHVSAIVKEGSIQEKHLQPNYLADIKVVQAAAQANQEAAAASEAAAKISETNAAASEAAAATSETNAKASEEAAAASEANAATSEANAATSEANAKASEEAAAASEANAATSETNAAASETNAKTSEDNAKASETAADDSATAAESWAAGGTGTRDGEDTDNSKYYAQQSAKEAGAAAEKVSAQLVEDVTEQATAAAASADDAKYYYEQAKTISESFSSALRPIGTVAYADLPALSDATAGDMYDISDQFTTTSSFKEGSGNVIPAGANIYKTSDGYWDVLAGSPVTGVKGNAETAYRRGNVNITKANIGLGNVDNTADANKSVKYAASAGSATNDANGNPIAGSYLPLTGGTLTGFLIIGSMKISYNTDTATLDFEEVT